jgi:hypothetical protein
MNHQVQMWVFPLVALIVGLLVFGTSKDKWATIGGYVFLCGFFIVLWLVSFGPAVIR